MSFCAFMALDLDTSSAFHRNFLRCLAGPEPGCRDGSRFSLVLCPERFRFWSSTPRHLNSVKAFACAGAASASVWCIRSAFGAPGATWMQMAVAFWSAWSRIYRWVSISALPRNTSKLDLIVRTAENSPEITNPTPSTQWRRIWDVHGDSSATFSELQAFFESFAETLAAKPEGPWMRQFYRSFAEKMSHLGATEGSLARLRFGLWDMVLQMFLSIGVFVWCSLVILKDFGQFMLIHSLWNFTSQNKNIWIY